MFKSRSEPHVFTVALRKQAKAVVVYFEQRFDGMLNVYTSWPVFSCLDATPQIMAPEAAKHNLSLVPLASPTSGAERLAQADWVQYSLRFVGESFLFLFFLFFPWRFAVSKRPLLAVDSFLSAMDSA